MRFGGEDRLHVSGSTFGRPESLRKNSVVVQHDCMERTTVEDELAETEVVSGGSGHADAMLVTVAMQ